MTDFTTNFNTIQFDGASFLIGAETVNVLWRNSDGDIFLASGTTVPTDATAGYGKGAMFFDTDATSTGSVFWVNEGSATSCKFVSVTAPTTITLAGDVTGDSDTNVVASISDTATVATNKKLQFRDTGLYINSSADGQLDIAADTTLAITAPATTVSGSLALATDKKLQFRDSALTISSTTDGQLDIAADTKLQLTSATTAVSAALSLAGDTTVATDKKMQFRDTGLYINSSADGQLDIAADTTLAITAPATTVSGSVTMATDKKIQLRDTAISLNSSADGQMDVIADGVVKITTPSTINTGVLNYAETAGTAPAYTLAVPITALVDGAMVMFKTDGASTDDDATINVNSLGAKPLCKASTGTQITDAGVLVDNGVYIAIYSTDVVVGGGWMVQGV